MSSAIPFTKGHGTGNDFVVIPDPDGAMELTGARVRAICDRHFGVGGDGLLRVVRSERVEGWAPDDSDPSGRVGKMPEWFMDYRNADGSVAEMCGNGIRVFGRYLVDHAMAPAGRIEVLTRGGTRVLHVPPQGDVCVDMGPARRIDLPEAPRVVVEARVMTGTAVALPNPHAVVFVDTLAGLPQVLRQPEFSSSDFPEGVNVELAVLPSDPEQPIPMRVYERGVGETLSCGTGACAVGVVAAERWGLSPGTEVVVQPPGGPLTVTVTAHGTVELRGPAVLVASGHFAPSWWHTSGSAT